MSDAQREKQVRRGMQELAKIVENIVDETNNLAGALEPIIIPTLPKGDTTKESAPEEGEELCEIAGQVSLMCSKLLSIKDNIIGLQTKIEI